MNKRSHVDDDSPAVKRPKSEAVSRFLMQGEYPQPVSDIVSITASRPQTQSTGPSSTSALSTDEIIKQKRAEIAAKMAAMTGKQPVFPGAPARTLPTAISAPKPGLPSSAEVGRRVAEAKKNAQGLKDNPYITHAGQGKKKGSASATPVPEPIAPQGAGLKMAAHPLLLDTATPAPQSKKDRYKPMQPKFASIRANIRNTPTTTPPPAPVIAPSPALDLVTRANPYAAGASVNTKDGAASGSFEGAAPKERVSRQLRFNQKGKYVAQATQMRQEQQMEALKQRIAENTKKAGLESVERAIRRAAPPVAEWWDESLLPSKSYDDISADGDTSSTKIRAADSPVTFYVQHPIKIPGAGSGSGGVSLKPLMLTTKERKKMRKQRRAAALQDRRDRIRMGLIPPDAPKVRLPNLMKVLASDAVQDPTRVEARVRREVAGRRHQHEKANAERRLTDEQRRAKIEAKKVEEERKGLVGAAFRVKNLSDPSHRFKARKNAEQHALTGLILLHPSCSLVYVEGSAKSMRGYTKLMLQRMRWTEPARARGNEEVEIEGHEDDLTDEGGKVNGVSVNIGSSSVDTVNGLTEGEGATDLADNRCDLIWEGVLRERAFATLRTRNITTDIMAKEALGAKLASLWDQCKNWKPEEVEFV